MLFSSSPLEYPPSASPTHESPRKKRKIQKERAPLTTIIANRTSERARGFLQDDSDGDEGDVIIWKERQALAQHDKATASTIQRTDIVLEDVGAAIHAGKPSEDQYLPPTPPDDYVVPASFVNPTTSRPAPTTYCSIRTCSGKTLNIRKKPREAQVSYQKIVSARSTEVAGRGQKSYYGIDIHTLIDEGAKDNKLRAATKDVDELHIQTSVEELTKTEAAPVKTLLWTEKYRARKFTDLVGDERTHRSVLHWLKAWDSIVFPNAPKPAKKKKNAEEQEPERQHRKILLLTGPPGLGKTTLAHVCAKQAGYEVQEINASDERSSSTVKGRIRDMACTENVRPADMTIGGKVRRMAKPVCVVVDEVDGVVSGSGAGGDGGFMKALSDLLVLDQKNTAAAQRRIATTDPTRKKKKGDNFRLLRPVILICNDLYNPSLRMLRQSNMAEIVYVRKPPLNMIIPRLHAIFTEEGIPCDNDGVRQLCEATWGISTKKENKSTNSSTDGDMRGILVVGEWVASKLRAEQTVEERPLRLTKRWVQQFVLGDLAHGGGAARSLGRGGTKEVVERVFSHNAGFPAAAPGTSTSRGISGQMGVADAAKERAMQRLAEMIESSGEDDRIMSDCFTSYPLHPFQDDTYLTKPTAAYDWLYFHDLLSHSVHTGQEWELASYLTSPVLAFHHLFASNSPYSSHAQSNTTKDDNNPNNTSKEFPFTGPRAPQSAYETLKASQSQLSHLQSSLSLPLLRSFRSTPDLATDLLPYVLRILNPDIKPVVVGGSGEKGVASVRRGVEKEMVGRGVQAMFAVGIRFEKSKVEFGGESEGGSAGAGGAVQGQGGWVYRMEPPVDSLGVFETMGAADGQKVRYAVRQVLDQEYKREAIKREQEARMRRGTEILGRVKDVGDTVSAGDKNGKKNTNRVVRDMYGSSGVVKRDFFGRLIVVAAGDAGVGRKGGGQGAGNGEGGRREGQGEENSREGRVWVTYHEGYSNAVRKPITLKELMEGL